MNFLVVRVQKSGTITGYKVHAFEYKSGSKQITVWAYDAWDKIQQHTYTDGRFVFVGDPGKITIDLDKGSVQA